MSVTCSTARNRAPASPHPCINSVTNSCDVDTLYDLQANGFRCPNLLQMANALFTNWCEQYVTYTNHTPLLTNLVVPLAIGPYETLLEGDSPHCSPEVACELLSIGYILPKERHARSKNIVGDQGKS